jgi:hypothetical protein
MSVQIKSDQSGIKIVERAYLPRWSMHCCAKKDIWRARARSIAITIERVPEGNDLAKKTKKKGGIHLVTRRDEVLERREDRQASADGGLMEELGAALATRGDDLVIQRLRSRECLFVRRDDVNSRAQQRRVRLRHGRGGRVVDEHHGVVAPHERRERAREVRGRRGGRRRQGCAEESTPVGGGRDAVRVKDGRFGGGERDEAEGVRGWESLELAHELGADQADANDGHRDGLGKQLGGRHRGRILRRMRRWALID